MRGGTAVLRCSARRVVALPDRRRQPPLLRGGAQPARAGRVVRRRGRGVGDEAVRFADALAPDLALVDIRLGGESGFDVARRLADGSSPSPPAIIFVSSYDEDEFGGRIAASPAVGFIDKTKLSAERIRRLLGARLARFEKPDHGEHAAVVVVGLGEAELDEDAVHVLFDRPFGDPQAARDPGVLRPSAISASTSRSREVMPASGSSAMRAASNSTTSDGSTTELPRPRRSNAVEELVDVRDPALQEVAGSLAAREQRGRVLDLDVGREDEDRDLRELVPDHLGRPQTFGGMVRGHPDVDDREVGVMLPNEIEQLGGVAGLTDDVVAGAHEQAGEPLTEQKVVVRDHDGRLGRLHRLGSHAGSMRDCGAVTDRRWSSGLLAERVPDSSTAPRRGYPGASGREP